MVLEMKVLHGATLSLLKPLIPGFINQLCQYYHLLEQSLPHAAGCPSDKWKGTVGKCTFTFLAFSHTICHRLDGENNFALMPIIVYGAVLLMCEIAYYILAHSLTNLHGKDPAFSRALGDDRKGKILVILYMIGIAVAFLHSLAGLAIYIMIAIMWVISDRRFETKDDCQSPG